MVESNFKPAIIIAEEQSTHIELEDYQASGPESSNNNVYEEIKTSKKGKKSNA